jgi:predicted solute-binding protein
LSVLDEPFKICAVNYLNTVPLVWGMLHGPQRERVELSFATPSVCAGVVGKGAVHLGLNPIAEIARQNLEVVPGYGIACRGAVRSILLVSQKPLKQIQTLATDSGSRTSVELARVILRELYGVEPALQPHQPELEEMLAVCDAALLIGDAALKIDPYTLPYQVLDLGAEWYALTGLPMVFALWSGRSVMPSRLGDVLEASYRFGHANIGQIVNAEWQARHVTRDLAYEYLTSYIRYEIGDEEWKGAEAFLELSGLPTVNITLAEAR